MGNEKIVVTVDPDLEDLIPGFMENRRKDLSALRAALERGDCQAMQATGHSLKGVGGGYGFTGLSGIGADIESAAKAGNTAALAGHVDRMADYLDRVEIVFG